MLGGAVLFWRARTPSTLCFQLRKAKPSGSLLTLLAMILRSPSCIGAFSRFTALTGILGR